jgi:hypothetical protein
MRCVGSMCCDDDLSSVMVMESVKDMNQVSECDKSIESSIISYHIGLYWLK